MVFSTNIYVHGFMLYTKQRNIKYDFVDLILVLLKMTLMQSESAFNGLAGKAWFVTTVRTGLQSDTRPHQTHHQLHLFNK